MWLSLFACLLGLVLGLAITARAGWSVWRSGRRFAQALSALAQRAASTQSDLAELAHRPHRHPDGDFGRTMRQAADPSR